LNEVLQRIGAHIRVKKRVLIFEVIRRGDGALSDNPPLWVRGADLVVEE